MIGVDAGELIDIPVPMVVANEKRSVSCAFTPATTARSIAKVKNIFFIEH